MEFNSKNLTQNSKPEGTKKLGNWRRKDNKFPWSYSEKQSLTITWDFKRKKPWVLSACVLTQLYMTLCNPVDCSPPGSSVHEIFQARILVWVAISSSEDQICLSWISCMGRWILYCWATWEAPLSTHYQYKESAFWIPSWIIHRTWFLFKCFPLFQVKLFNSQETRQFSCNFHTHHQPDIKN